MVEFCDDSDNATVKHYRKAKNDQNYVCDMRSSWEVMRETDDFRNGRNPPRDVADIRPTIRVRRVFYLHYSNLLGNASFQYISRMY